MGKDFTVYLGCPGICLKVASCMNIVILSHAQYITVGLPKIIEFAETLASLGHQVTLCTTSRTRRWGFDEHLVNGVHIVQSPSLMLGKLRHGVDPYDALNRIFSLKKDCFDVIHCVASRPTVFYPGIYLKKKCRSLLIYEWEDSFAERGVALERRGTCYYRLFGGVENYFEEAILKYADGVVVVSDFLRERAVRLGVREQSILQQVKGTQLIHEDLPPKHEAKRKLCQGANDSAILFTYVGSIYESDLDLLFKSFGLMSAAHPNVKLILVGYNRRQPQYVPRNVNILPRVPYEDYVNCLAATDVFVLPLKCSIANMSRYPSKFGDYLAVGRPVVTTPLPSIQKMIQAADCGYIAENDTEKAFAASMIEAVRDQARWSILGENGKQYASHHLSWDQLSKRMVGFYQQFLRQGW
jgi:glycosyltransferase involved in cell wall biosynthesis